MFKYTKFVAGAAAALMTVSTLSTAVFADGVEGTEGTPALQPQASFTKTVEVAGGKNLTLPVGTSFSFTAASDTTKQEASWDANSGTEFAGIPGAVSISNAVVADDENTVGLIEFTNPGVTIDTSKFEIPGSYVYTITENDFNVNGVTKDATSYTLKFFIDNEKNVSNIVFSNGSDKVSKPEFVNQYDVDPITVTKTVTGNQANMNETFKFNITINGRVGQTFTMGGVSQTVASDTTPITFEANLKNGESVTIDGLTADDTYTVKENGADSYKTTWSVSKKGTVEKTGDNKYTDLITAQNSGEEIIAFTNKKEGIVPTGLLFTVTPYVTIAGLGGLFAAMFFRRKRED